MSGGRAAEEGSEVDARQTAEDAESGSDDGLLKSIGKAIIAPVEGAAEPEEPGAHPAEPPLASSGKTK